MDLCSVRDMFAMDHPRLHGQLQALSCTCSRQERSTKCMCSVHCYLGQRLTRRETYYTLCIHVLGSHFVHAHAVVCGIGHNKGLHHISHL